MRALAWATAAALLAFTPAAAPAATPAPCVPQPMPSPLDSVPPPRDTESIVAFAATAWEYPGRAWVIRLSSASRAGPGTLEVIRLRRREDCNLYALEGRWQAPVAAAEYRSLLSAAEPLATPPPGFSHGESGTEEVIDGTAIELRLVNWRWETRRSLNHDSRSGAAVSALFRPLAARLVPVAKMPAEDWRTRRPQR